MNDPLYENYKNSNKPTNPVFINIMIIIGSLIAAATVGHIITKDKIHNKYRIALLADINNKIDGQEKFNAGLRYAINHSAEITPDTTFRRDLERMALKYKKELDSLYAEKKKQERFIDSLQGNQR